MKIFKTAALAALLIAIRPHGFAQTNPPVNEPDYNKPKAFADLPEKMPLRLEAVDALLALPVGTPVRSDIANGFSLYGAVVSKSAPAGASRQSVVVKSDVRQGAVFTISRIRNADGSFSYQGRMWGRQAGDALEIGRDGAAYVIRKKGHYDVVNE